MAPTPARSRSWTASGRTPRTVRTTRAAPPGLIRAATADTYWHWIVRYGSLPQGLRLRTEVCLKRARERGSTNPGYCYLMAGWERGEVKRGKLHLWAPRPEAA